MSSRGTRVKVEPTITNRKKAARGADSTDPGMLQRLGAAVGVCSRPPTAAQRLKLVNDLMNHTKEGEDKCTKLLEQGGWAVPSAMKLWAGEQGAVVVDDSDDDESPEMHHSKTSDSRKAAAPCDMASQMLGSSYGRIMKTIKRAY